jgi:F420-dependent oxidoreductase-like protein
MIEGQEGANWSERLRLARTAEGLGFESFLTSDHYLSPGGTAERGSFDAWTGVAALAAATERIRLGTMVSPVTFRHPTVLAKAATTVDVVSGGRVELGMGAGWWTEEHTTHGIPFPPTSDRFEMLEEQVEIVHGLFTKEVFSFEGRFYAIEECRFVPKPVQKPHPPIVLGGRAAGPRMSRLVARFADEFNTLGGTPSEVHERLRRIRDAVDAVGRDQSTVSTSMMTWYYIGDDDAAWRARVERSRGGDPEAGPADEYLARLERTCILGTPDRVVERLAEYVEAGVQRIVLNHEFPDDLEMLQLVGERVLPQLAGDNV